MKHAAETGGSIGVIAEVQYVPTTGNRSVRTGAWLDEVVLLAAQHKNALSPHLVELIVDGTFAPRMAVLNNLTGDVASMLTDA